MLTSKNDRGIQIRRRIKYLIFGFRSSIRHLLRFVKYGMCNYYESQQYFLTHIILMYHVMEKNLAMPNFEPGHGSNNLKTLIGDLIKYSELGYDVKHPQFISAVQSVFEYEKVHNALKYKLGDDICEDIYVLHSIVNVSEHEQPLISSRSFFSKSSSDFENFSQSRHSVRAFSDKSIPDEILKKVVFLSNTTPTPCNRQPNKVYAVRNKKIIKKIVEIQGGGRGFAEKADVILIITSAVSSFMALEMNEVWKTAGMYAMNMLYALHYYKIGACPLEWNERVKEDNLLRKMIDIPNDEEVVMLIAIGYPLDEFKYVTSTRNSYLDSFFVVE